MNRAFKDNLTTPQNSRAEHIHVFLAEKREDYAFLDFIHTWTKLVDHNDQVSERKLRYYRRPL